MNEPADNPYRTPEAYLVQPGRDRSILKFRRFSAWGVLGLAIVTLGIYPYYWIYTRAKIINSVHDDKIPMAWPTSLFIVFILSYATNFVGESNEALVANLTITLIYLVLYVIVLFKIRNRLQNIINRSGNQQYKLGAALTFFFYAIYLQYKINECIDDLQPAKQVPSVLNDK